MKIVVDLLQLLHYSVHEYLADHGGFSAPYCIYRALSEPSIVLAQPHHNTLRHYSDGLRQLGLAFLELPGALRRRVGKQSVMLFNPCNTLRHFNNRLHQLGLAFLELPCALRRRVGKQSVMLFNPCNTPRHFNNRLHQLSLAFLELAGALRCASMSNRLCSSSLPTYRPNKGIILISDRISDRINSASGVRRDLCWSSV